MKTCSKCGEVVTEDNLVLWRVGVSSNGDRFKRGTICYNCYDYSIVRRRMIDEVWRSCFINGINIDDSEIENHINEEDILLRVKQVQLKRKIKEHEASKHKVNVCAFDANNGKTRSQ